MVRKSGNRFSEKTMLELKSWSVLPPELAPDLIRGGYRFAGQKRVKTAVRKQGPATGACTATP
jgi:hypothetical protein